MSLKYLVGTHAEGPYANVGFASATFEVEEGETVDLLFTTSAILDAGSPPGDINIMLAHTSGTPPLDASKDLQ